MGNDSTYTKYVIYNITHPGIDMTQGWQYSIDTSVISSIVCILYLRGAWSAISSVLRVNIKASQGQYSVYFARLYKQSPLEICHQADSPF